jgi:hypothetical protein
LIFGITATSISRPLTSRSVITMVSPVRFPPGLARLATWPVRMGSACMVKTMGIEDVAVFAAGLDQDVPVLDPAALPQLFPEALPQASLRRVRGLFPQDADAIHLPRLLRPGGERRGEDTG